MVKFEQEIEKKMKRKSEDEKESGGSKVKSRRNSVIVDMDEEIPASQSPPPFKRSETEKKPIFPEYKNKLTNKSINRLKNEERGSRGVSILSSPSIMISSASSSKPSTSSASLSESFMAEVKLKVKESPQIFDVDEIFDKLKETRDEESKIKEELVHKKSSSEAKKPTHDQISPSKLTTEVASSKFTALSKFQPDMEWSKITVNTIKHLKESSANLRVMVKELKTAK